MYVDSITREPKWTSMVAKLTSFPWNSTVLTVNEGLKKEFTVQSLNHFFNIMQEVKLKDNRKMKMEF